VFRKLLATLGIGAASLSSIATGQPYSPYTEPVANDFYNLLFCDDPTPFKPKPNETPTDWQATLFGNPIDPNTVQLLAQDTNSEGRIRALAFNWLRQNGHTVPPQQLLAVIIEVPIDGGLDVLAAFSDGGVRYVNQTGKLAIFEGPIPELLPVVKRLFAESENVVRRIGPWGKSRLPPPVRSRVRLTFLVSDGLYFGEGPMSVMQNEPFAGPVLREASELLQLVVKIATK